MTTLEIILLIIAICEVMCVVLGFCNSKITKDASKRADKLMDDVRFQRDIAQTNYRNWTKACLENGLLREKLNGSAYNHFKSTLEDALKEVEKCDSSDGYDKGRKDAINSILTALNAWENQANESDD